jgi:hypothetical protein
MEVTNMKNIEVFNHEILGEMNVFGDEKGLWFNLYDVAEKLDIAKSTATFKFKHMSKDLKQCVDCVIEKYDPNTQPHRFIHEKVVYELMCIGNSPYCDEFRQWVGDIAYDYDYLNMRCNESQLGMYGNAQTDYSLIKEYISRVNDPSPIGIAVKNAMNELDEFFNDEWVSSNNKPVICEKSYRTDYTIDEARNDPNFDPSIIEENEIEEEFDWNKLYDETDDSTYELLMNFNIDNIVQTSDDVCLLIDDYDEEYDSNNPPIMTKKENCPDKIGDIPKRSYWVRTEIK